METEAMVVLISAVGITVIIIFLITWFMSTYHRRIRKKFRESVETSGTIVDISKKCDDDENVSYVITYTYYNGSRLFEKSFECANRKLKVNDKIVVYYDRQNPDNAVTAVQIEWEKSLWWKMLIAFAVIIITVLIFAIRGE